MTKESKDAETNRLREYAEAFPYQFVVGALMYLAVHTRPDMSHTVNLLSRFNTRPTYVVCQAALHTLVYFDNTVEHGIVFPNLTDEEPLRAYSDAD